MNHMFFFAQQASIHDTHDDEDLLQIDDDAMEEIDIRWQVAMITARIRKFMRKTGRPIDLKPKNGITFDKQTEANGSKEKKIVPIEDSNSKALVAKDSQGEIDWTKEFDDDPVTSTVSSNQRFNILQYVDPTSGIRACKESLIKKNSFEDLISLQNTKMSEAENHPPASSVTTLRIPIIKKDDDPVTFAMMALNVIEEDDWSIEIDADHVDLGQDGLGVFDWSEEADNAPVALALMATSSTDSSNSECNDPKGGRITGKGTIKTSCIDFENVSYVKELKFNLLSVSQICDKKHNVLFTDTECLILSPEFKIVDENLVLLRAPRKNDVYSLNLKSIIPSGGVTCLVARASEDEAILWHRRLGHVKFKNINKLVKSNLVRGLPSKTFIHDHSCLACRKGKQHKASCKKLEEKTVREPLELLHMDLFGPVSVASLNRKKYCLVVTDDYSRFSWVFFLVYKDETYDILHDLIVGLENKLRRKVKTIRCDHGTEFKNKLMNEFCAKKGIQREYSIARTPQQNGIAERKNRTLIEAARTILADSLLPIQF
ncbi:putative ribonuclease H-like domain-containing protein [Tanacetum coccineum]